ncbi:MAG TPA: hypothetical protein VNT81_09555 [Vicinamibacterales bacterium]|nr:hypothetical protein [Vicinamibacterales bacterium]
MVAGTILYVGLMLMSAVFKAGLHPWVAMIVIAGAIPALAIAVVTLAESIVRRQQPWRSETGAELKTLAARMATKRQDSPLGAGRATSL